MRVLIVDDSSTMRKIIRKTVMEAGVSDIAEAEDGIDALKRIKDHNAAFDLILLDINMPKVDGITTLKQLKSMDQTKGIPVIMCTSEAEKELVITSIKAGASDYVVKPFTKDVIFEKINRLSAKPA
ncbi:MAG: response regulator [Myxococcales bacterium]|nr:MAG: response regulator [Myxococcales bacterium]